MSHCFFQSLLKDVDDKVPFGKRQSPHAQIETAMIFTDGGVYLLWVFLLVKVPSFDFRLD